MSELKQEKQFNISKLILKISKDSNIIEIYPFFYSIAKDSRILRNQIFENRELIPNLESHQNFCVPTSITFFFKVQISYFKENIVIQKQLKMFLYLPT